MKRTGRGYAGRGGGAWKFIKNPVFLRGTTDQIAGLTPWLIGSGAPPIGVPLGRVKRKQAKGVVICCDPISWFERAHLLSQPSAFILGLPGLGKSTLIRRWIMGLDYYGVKSLVLGDLKGEYVDLIKALGGQVILVGRGRGFINILDMSEAITAVLKLRSAGKRDAANQLLAEAKGRRQSAVETLLTIKRNDIVTSRESSVLSTALRILDEKFDQIKTPILQDLADIIITPTEALHTAAMSRGDIRRYQDNTESLEADLQSLARGEGVGEIFSKNTTTQMKRGEHVVFDVSSIDDTDQKLQAAALMLCWSIGFASVSVSNALADAGLEVQRKVHIVQDELWRALRAGPGLVDMSDGLTRLNRDKGVAVTKASHTMDDLKSLPTEQDRAKAAGMVERSGMVIAAGLPASEMPRLATAVKLSGVEQRTLQSWTTPPAWNAHATASQAPPGQGNFLIKVGERAGIQFHLDLTETEKNYSLTSKRWTT